MDFKIVMTVSQANLGSFLSNFTKAQLAGIELIPANPTDQSAKTKPGTPPIIGEPNGIIALGDAAAPTGDVSLAIYNELQRMELDNGVGTITRRELAAHCKKLGITKWPNEPIIDMLKKGVFVSMGVTK